MLKFQTLDLDFNSKYNCIRIQMLENMVEIKEDILLAGCIPNFKLHCCVIQTNSLGKEGSWKQENNIIIAYWYVMNNWCMETVCK
jgi:hypothetical protein